LEWEFINKVDIRYKGLAKDQRSGPAFIIINFLILASLINADRMMVNNPGKHFGSLIGLREEAAGPYILLHRNVFPSVLVRIARSNIANYSIFLLDGILFGFYDYLGADYEKDIGDIAEDHDTQIWWKLTEPLQMPLPGRKDGEWWAEMEHLFSSLKEGKQDGRTVRKAFKFHSVLKKDEINIEELLEGLDADQCRIELFELNCEIYLYAEPLNEEDPGNNFPRDRWIEMKEVFHTDGCRLPARKKVFVTGCFDMLHSGHVAFLKEASSFGNLYVGIGSDANVSSLKGRFPVNNEEERRFMLESVRHVHQCLVNKGWGIMDFLQELDEIRPDIFVVNEDGHTPEKQDLCRRSGIEYKVLKRVPHAGLPVRSTTVLRTECRIPFRIDLAGGWLDQPFVSKYFPGPVLTISIEPTLEFNDRSGMASSTRRKAIELWKTDIPPGDPEILAKMLFSYDNPPGTSDISGSQDALGIVMPGLNRLDYRGAYWPEKISPVLDEDILQWLENHLYLVTLGPRTGNYTVVSNNRINEPGARRLSMAAQHCWDAILAKDLKGFGTHFRESFEAQVAMFPNMADESIFKAIGKYSGQALGWKLSGAGGGGYLILVSESHISGAFQIRIRRRSNI
jgi:cytidyltransferase-like protein